MLIDKIFRAGTMLIILNERLKECRKRKNVTQSEIARSLDIELRSYVRYEKGDRKPDIEMLYKLADFFDVSTDYLLGRDNDK